MDLEQVTRTIAGGRRQALAGLLAGAAALGTHRLAAAKQRKKRCKKCPKRAACPQRACCSCNAGGGEPELCGTIEAGATVEETAQRCSAFCQSVGGGNMSVGQPAPDTVNHCVRVPCPLS